MMDTTSIAGHPVQGGHQQDHGHLGNTPAVVALGVVQLQEKLRKRKEK